MNKKSACIDFRTNLENSLEGHNQLVDSNERLISFNYQFSRGKFPVLHHNFRLNPRTGLFGMTGYYSMNKKSACIDFRTNLENSLEGHNQLVDSNERLISFHYQLSHIPVELLYKKYHGGNQQ
jgi:hypothetical protein